MARRRVAGVAVLLATLSLLWRAALPTFCGAARAGAGARRGAVLRRAGDGYKYAPFEWLVNFGISEEQLAAVVKSVPGVERIWPDRSKALAREEPVSVLLLGGQSNMVGQAKTRELPADAAEPQDSVKIWREDQWCALAPGKEKFGPELSLGRALALALPDRRFFLVKYAADGTALYNDWSPEGEQYEVFMATTFNALSELQSRGVPFRIAAMLWMQGESDALEGKAKSYEENLRSFISRVRGHFRSPRLPFVMGRIKDYYGRESGQARIVRAAQERVAAELEGVSCFDTDGYPGLLGDEGHYNAEGQRRLGEDFAKALLKGRGAGPAAAAR